MNIYEMSMPATPHNISIVRKIAKEQGYSLKKVRNEDIFDLFDNQSETYRFRNTPLGDIYDSLVSNDD